MSALRFRRPEVGGRAAVLLIAPLLTWLLASGMLLASPAGAAKSAEPSLAARAWLLIDAETGDVLASDRPGRELPIASATKLMTAYLTLRDLPLNERLRAPGYDALPAESVLGLKQGEQISARDLLVAMMLPSANDAAFTLADGVAGSVGAFVKEMNAAADELGLDSTSYANPIGLDDPDNYSSAADLATLALELREDKRFRKIVSKPEATLRSGASTRTVTTRNTLLLSDPSVDGIKTGHTIGAGYVLVASAEREGVQLLSAVLGAPSEAARDSESEKLLDYGFSLYSEKRLIRAREDLASVPVRDTDATVSLVADNGISATVRSDQTVETSIDAPADVEGPIEVGQDLGRAVVTVDGRKIGSVALLSANAVAAPGFFQRLELPLGAILIAGGSILIAVALLIALRRGRETSGESSRARTAEERLDHHRRRVRRRKGNES